MAGALEAERKLRKESQKIQAEAARLRAKVEEMTEDSVAALRQARAPPRAARRAAPPPRSRLRRGRATAPSCALPRSRVQAREFVKDGREGIELDVVTLERVLAEFGLLQRWVAEMQQASPTPAPSIFHATSIAIPIVISRTSSIATSPASSRAISRAISPASRRSRRRVRCAKRRGRTPRCWRASASRPRSRPSTGSPTCLPTPSPSWSGSARV